MKVALLLVGIALGYVWGWIWRGIHERRARLTERRAEMAAKISGIREE